MIKTNNIRPVKSGNSIKKTVSYAVSLTVWTEHYKSKERETTFVKVTELIYAGTIFFQMPVDPPSFVSGMT